jgi:hypothetical protein
MNQPTGKKDVMKLTGMMAALGHFISKLGKKGLLFFKLLKKSDKFEWIDEADQALEELKTFLTTHPIMVPPRTHRDIATLHLRIHPGGQRDSSG